MATQMDAGVSRTISKVSAATANVRFGSLADICTAIGHVRFTPNSGHGLGQKRDTQVLNQMQHRHCHAYGKKDDGNSQSN
jgi:hypothetical protein